MHHFRPEPSMLEFAVNFIKPGITFCKIFLLYGYGSELVIEEPSQHFEGKDKAVTFSWKITVIKYNAV